MIPTLTPESGDTVGKGTSEENEICTEGKCPDDIETATNAAIEQHSCS